MARSRDPMEGLPLTIIQPAPPMRATDLFSPIIAGIDSASVARPTPEIKPAEMKPLEPTTDEVLGDQGGIVGGIVKTLFGTPAALQSEEEKGQSDKKAKEAGALASNAASNPGDQFMGIPSGGSNSAGISDLISFVLKSMTLA